MTDVADAFRQVAANMRQVADSTYVDALGRAADLLYESFTTGGTLLTFGNGGSSADAQHLAAELVGRFTIERHALPAIALTSNQAILTAWSNDYSFEDVFARQIEAIGRPGDVAFGISTSGTSVNVLNALRRAREKGLRTVGLTGPTGGKMGELCDVLLAAPVMTTPRIQEVHLVTYHTLCALLEQRMFGQ